MQRCIVSYTPSAFHFATLQSGSRRRVMNFKHCKQIYLTLAICHATEESYCILPLPGSISGRQTPAAENRNAIPQCTCYKYPASPSILTPYRFPSASFPSRFPLFAPRKTDRNFGRCKCPQFRSVAKERPTP